MKIIHPSIGCMLSKNAIKDVENDGSMELWNKRLGLLSEKGMFVFFGLHLQKCSHFFAEKQHIVFFMFSAPSWKPKVLNLVHSDVCGPMKTKYFGDESFFGFD